MNVANFLLKYHMLHYISPSTELTVIPIQQVQDVLNEIIWDKNLDNQSFDCRRGKPSINITITLHFMLLSWQCFLYWVISYLKTWKDTGWIIQFISHTHCHWDGNIISAFSHCIMAHVLSYFSQWHIYAFVVTAVLYYHYHYYDCYDYHEYCYHYHYYYCCCYCHHYSSKLT